MLTWQRGRQIVTARRADKERSLLAFIAELRDDSVPRVPGTAVFPHPNKQTTPLALRANIAHYKVLHEHIVIMSGRTANVPHIPWDRRITVDQLGDPDDGIVHIDAEFGFQDPTDFPEVLRRVAGQYPETDLDPDGASYFVSRISLRRTDQPGMVGWRKRLFLALAQNAPSQTENLNLPPDRTVVMSGEVPL
jgi:KUP system potassium uptake protein